MFINTFSSFCCLIPVTICLIDSSSACFVELMLSINVLPSIKISIWIWLDRILPPDLPENRSANFLEIKKLSNSKVRAYCFSTLDTLVHTCWIVFDFNQSGLTFLLLLAKNTILPPPLLAPYFAFLQLASVYSTIFRSVHSPSFEYVILTASWCAFF